MGPTEKETSNAEELIIYHIEKAKENGSINNNKVSKALEGVYLALYQVKEKIKESQYEPAIEISLVSLKHPVDTKLNVRVFCFNEVQKNRR